MCTSQYRTIRLGLYRRRAEFWGMMVWCVSDTVASTKAIGRHRLRAATVALSGSSGTHTVTARTCEDEDTAVVVRLQEPDLQMRLRAARTIMYDVCAEPATHSPRPTEPPTARFTSRRGTFFVNQ